MLVVLVGLLSSVALLGLQVRETAAVQEAQREALAAAEDAVEAVLAYDHRTIDADIEQAQDHATGDFLEEYLASTADLTEQARAGEVLVAARVHAASVVRGTPERVVVLLFADQSTTRKDRAEPRIDQSRLRLVLEPVGGTWRVAELESL